MTAPSEADRLLSEEVRTLEDHSLFQPLSKEVQQAIWDSGRVVTYAPGTAVDIRSPNVEFINFVLAGELAVEVLQTDQTIRVRRAKSRFVFGTISSFLGTGQFLRAKAISESRVFALNRARLLKLLSNFPNLISHFTTLRLGIALRMAEHHERGLAQHEEASTRVAMRFSAVGLHLRMLMEDKSFLPVENVSETGLFVKGEIPLAVGDHLSFRIEAVEPSNEPLDLTGRIIRKLPEGTGLALDNMDEPTTTAWVDIVEKARCLRIDQLLRPQLTLLPSPLPATAIDREVHVEGLITSMGIEGAIFRSTLALRGKVVITDRQTFRIPAEVVEVRGKMEYVLFFPRTRPEEEESIREILSGGVVLNTPPRVIEEFQPVNRRVLHRNINRKAEFCRFYFQELAEQTVYAKTQEPLGTGTAVDVHVTIDPAEIPIPKSRSEIVIRGRVIRSTGGDLLVGIEHVDMERIREVKSIVNSISRSQSEQKFRQVAHKEHNVKLRRHAQLGLILLLLASALIWLHFTLVEKSF